MADSPEGGGAAEDIIEASPAKKIKTGHQEPLKQTRPLPPGGLPRPLPPGRLPPGLVRRGPVTVSASAALAKPVYFLNLGGGLCSSFACLLTP
jgi:hypothetical protein